jgi:hypothetical protein
MSVIFFCLNPSIGIFFFCKQVKKYNVQPESMLWMAGALLFSLFVWELNLQNSIEPIFALMGIRGTMISSDEVLSMFRYSVFLNTFTENIPHLVVQSSYFLAWYQY